MGTTADDLLGVPTAVIRAHEPELSYGVTPERLLDDLAQLVASLPTPTRTAVADALAGFIRTNGEHPYRVMFMALLATEKL